MSDKDWGWMVAKMGTGDVAFFADLKPIGGDSLPELIEAKHLTQIIISNGKISYLLWPPERLGMVKGPIVLRPKTWVAFAPAEGSLIDELEQAWELKKVQEARKPLIFPGNGM